MNAGPGYSRYMRSIGLGKRTFVEGFDIDSSVIPSERFYTGKIGETPSSRLDDPYREPTITELKSDQDNLYRLYKQGEIPSAQYQKEWYALEEQIKALREPQPEAEDDDEEL